MMMIYAKFYPVINRYLRHWDWIPVFIARLVVGVMFCLSGWGKLHDVPGLGSWFGDLGIPFPHLNAAFIATLEFVGGACLIVGLGTRLFAFLLACTMAVALITVGPQSDAKTLGDWLYKPETLLIVIFVWHMFVGTGKLGFDGLIARKLTVQSNIRRSET
jgi:putative oxidoreductase